MVGRAHCDSRGTMYAEPFKTSILYQRASQAYKTIGRYTRLLAEWSTCALETDELIAFVKPFRCAGATKIVPRTLDGTFVRNHGAGWCPEIEIDDIKVPSSHARSNNHNRASEWAAPF
jgi:hypothetical protein